MLNFNTLFINRMHNKLTKTIDSFVTFFYEKKVGTLKVFSTKRYLIEKYL